MDFLREPEVWIGLGFVIVVGIILYKKVPGMIARALDARATTIAKELDTARMLREEAQALLAQYQAKQRGADKEVEAIITEARAEAERYAKEASTAIAAQIERRSKQAQEKIAQAEAQAVAEVRALAADAAVAAAEKLISSKLDEKRAVELVKKSLGEIPSKLN
jgi:F-type H+-transporting ATPase subunit b